MGDTAHYRSIWSSVAAGVAEDLQWDGSGGASAASRGDLRPGASRTFFAAQSASSNSNNDKLGARAFFASDASRLFVYDSAGTFLAGTPFLAEYGSGASLGAGAAIRELSGVTTVSDVTTAVNRSVSVLAPFFDADGGDFAQTFVAFATSSERSVMVRPILNTITASGDINILLTYRGTTNAGSTATFHWTALGRNSSASSA